MTVELHIACRHCGMRTHYSGMCDTIPSKVYVLKCADEKWYVGQTKNVEERFNNHKEGAGAKWTKQFPPLEIVEVIECDYKERLLKENEMTLKYIEKYGIENVAGGNLVYENNRIAFRRRQRIPCEFA